MTFKKKFSKIGAPSAEWQRFQNRPSQVFLCITSQSLIDIHNFKDFSKNSNPDFFLVFEDIDPIFCTVTHANDLISGYDCHDDQTFLRPSTGCESWGPHPMPLSCARSPWQIGLKLNAYFVKQTKCTHSFFWKRFILIRHIKVLRIPHGAIRCQNSMSDRVKKKI